MAKLTKRVVDAARPGPREHFLWDPELPGFGLRVLPSGVKTYLVQYRNETGRTRRLRLGAHGRLTPTEARRLAREHLAAVSAGRDPAEERRQARAEGELAAQRTVEAVATAWLELQEAREAKGLLRPNTLREYRREVKTEIVPRLGGRRLAELSLADAQALHDALAGRPVLANRVLGLLATVWRWAEGRGLVGGPSPTREVEPYRERRREQHLTHKDLAALGRAMRELEAAGKLKPRIAALVRLIALTGCRPGEIKTLRWQDVDLGRQMLRLAEAKTGARPVWLARAALETLAGLERAADRSEWVFPGRAPGRPVGAFRKPWATILAKAELPRVVPYVLRHTFASESEACGHSAFLTAALLGLRLGGREVTRGYVHHVPVEVRQATERVAGRIASALDGKGAAAPVVRLRGRRRS